MILKKLLLLYSVIFLSVDVAQAATKADSVLALTGNKNTRFVWVRWPWADQNYNPVSAYSQVNLYNDHPFTQIVSFNTETNTTRYLDSSIGSHCYPRFTRKDGSQVVWADDVNKCAWISDFAGTTPKRKLIASDDYSTAACQYDPATGKEYVYVIGSTKKTLYRIEFNANYTLNISTKISIYSGSEIPQGALSVSADGKYIGGEMPWPNTEIFDVENNQHLARRWPSGAFGCQPNLAPDNSYRFFHLHDDHMIVSMWDSSLSTKYWDVPFNLNMPGNVTGMDIAGPRWTNNVRFLTNGYPLQGGFMDQYSNSFFGMNSAQVKASDASKAGSFCFGKFSQDYRSIESYVRISDGDIRHRDVIGDAWVASSVDNTAPSVPANVAGTPNSESRISLTWTASTDAESGILEYNVFRGGVRIATVAGVSFVDSNLPEATTYQYSVAAVNGASMPSGQSAAKSVTTLNDTRKPTIRSATALGKSNQVMIIFSEPVSKASAELITNYAVGSSMVIASAQLQTDNATVILTLSTALIKNTAYSVTISNVADRAATPNVIVASSVATFTFFPCGDDFNASALAASTWTTVNTYTGSVKQESGHLYIKADGQSLVENNQFYGVKRTDFTGDFDVWVKILNSNVAPCATQQGIIAANNLSTLSAGGNVTAGIEYYNDQTTTALPTGAAYVMRYSKTATGVLDNRMELHSNVTLPCWVRLVKKGSVYSSYVSISGPSNWMEIGTVTVAGATTRSDVGLFSASQSGQPWGSHAWFDEFACTVEGQGNITASAKENNVVTISQPSMKVFTSLSSIIVRADGFKVKSLSLVSPSGRIIAQAKSSAGNQGVISISKAPKGMYVLIAKTEAGDMKQSIIIR